MSTEQDVRRGRAIVDLIAWIESDGTTKALAAIDLLDLSDEDLETLFQMRASEQVVRIPHLGRVK